MRALGLLLVVCASASFAQSFDPVYGGLIGSPCAGGSASHFYREKSGQRWWLCTPAGDKFYLLGVGGIIEGKVSAIDPVAKYGSDANWAAEQVNFIKSLKFNTVGEESDGTMYATVNSNQAPFIQTINVTAYSTVNLNGYSTRPVKDMIWGTNENYARGGLNFREAGCVDAFDSAYPTFIDTIYASDGPTQAMLASPFLVAMMSDDTDLLCGVGATPDWPTTPIARYKPHLGWITLLASPIQAFNPGKNLYQGTATLYGDTAVHTKVAAVSPPATCAMGTPCTLRDYLSKKYTTIGALNTAWGSTYTTFDSSGTNVSNEVIATGDGSTQTFNATLAHGSVSPFSVIVTVGSTGQGGDCPWFRSECNTFAPATSYPYNCTSSGQCLGGFNGPSGTTISTGVPAPWADANSPMSTQFTGSADCGGCGLPQATYSFRTVWHGPAGCTSPPSPQRAFNFIASNGYTSPQITVLADNQVNDKPSCATGVDIYVACKKASGSASHGCAGSSDPYPLETLQATNVAYPSGSWQESTSGLVAGSALPGPPAFIDYHDGSIQLVFTTPPANGAQIKISYTYNGWMFGTGVMDEDGRNTGWVGTNGWCLLTRSGSTPGSTSYGCAAGIGSDHQTIDANQNLAVDLSDWMKQYYSLYFSIQEHAIHATAPDAIYMGPDTLGDWDGPARKEVLEAAAPYLDALFWLWSGVEPDDTTATGKYTFASQYIGDIPMIDFITLDANPDSALAAYSNASASVNYATQPDRGAGWYNAVNKALNLLSYNNSYQWVGSVWWALNDFNAGPTDEHLNWGLKTPADNGYDGVSATSGTAPCPAPLAAYTCGGEPAPGGSAVRPFGDLYGGSTGVIAANSLWFAGMTPITSVLSGTFSGTIH